MSEKDLDVVFHPKVPETASSKEAVTAKLPSAVAYAPSLKRLRHQFETFEDLGVGGLNQVRERSRERRIHTQTQTDTHRVPIRLFRCVHDHRSLPRSH